MTLGPDRVLGEWGCAGQPAVPHAVGRINDTWMVGERYVLQRLNSKVFVEPLAVTRNLAKVLDHDDASLVAPLETVDGEPFACDETGSVWRLFPRINGRNFQVLPDELFEVAGHAFGGFLARCAAFPGALEVVIRGFHDLNGYLAALDAAVGGAEEERRRIDRLRGLFPAPRVGRLIHGDCKVDNLLFHPCRAEVVAVIDLDTVMVGDPAWDFGDLVRSVFAGTEGDGEGAGAPLSRRRFERLVRGFVGAFGTVDDIDRFATAPAYMSFMLAVRFLADHLGGDVYFKVTAHGDNLRRARSQLDLAESFMDARSMLLGVLDDIVCSSDC